MILCLFQLKKFQRGLNCCNILFTLATYFEQIKFQKKASYWRCRIYMKKRKFNKASKLL